MIKTYKSNSSISISVVLPDTGKSVHVTFAPLSDGSSLFATDDASVQKALERHYRFGSMFFEIETPKEPKKVQKKEEECKPLVVKVTDLDSAKDYLAENFGVSRTQLRTQRAIETTAAANGIVFEGL